MPTKKGLVNFESELSTDNKGNVTIKQAVGNSLGGINVSYTYNPDGSHTISEGTANLR